MHQVVLTQSLLILIAIPAERFAIALYQSNLQAIPTERFAIALHQPNQISDRTLSIQTTSDRT
ncbi:MULTISPECIES: hypothetical protein [Nostocales]|uniref:Uncharacterized protein n=1 Tax=Dolichospermum flos-aquae UHCC 0037 TaxID=2590026 RepID=A0ACC7S112_DOLFA|nr:MULTISPECIES: hypothetical protein [Nostocales]MBO1064023.1 hypothetical protein [Anabaena sp. 54]MTJ41891.1 hypothetical protein [Dolichospermum flos-aquae UHCC 0037]